MNYVKQIWEARVEGNTGQERPRIEWDGDMGKIVNKNGETLVGMKKLL